VNETLERNAGLPGAGALKRALARYTEPPLTRSGLENFFFRLCRKQGLRKPAVNAVVAGYEVDFLGEDERLIVETDGREYHLTPTAFEEDRARDARLAILGYRVLRFSRRQVRYEPELVARSISSTR
jgi:very-short-patch-repair endonuclease